MSDNLATGDRPSRHGAIMGRALSALVEAGGGSGEMCATCAFREGSLANTSAGTGLTAFKCAVGIDSDPFGCHHGMKEGEPTKLCAGWHAAQKARFETVTAITANIIAELDAQSGPDLERQAYDRWLAETDPHGEMDVYQAGRAYARASLNSDPTRGTNNG